jgi:uncharacterized protein
MNKIYNTSKSRFIAYNQYKSKKKNAPYVIFLHGLMSSMESTKALYTETHCINQGYNFIRFDNFGHGQSSGKFLEETIGSWFSGLEMVLNQLVPDSTILVGSSMGAWLALLAGLKIPNKINGIVCTAPAIDFTEEAIWHKLPPLKQEQMKKEGMIEITGNGTCNNHVYPISYQLINEARSHLLLGANLIKIDCPVQLIHGILDDDVPYTNSTQLFEKITSQNIVLKLIKDGDHRLTNIKHLKIISNAIDEIL